MYVNSKLSFFRILLFKYYFNIIEKLEQYREVPYTLYPNSPFTCFSPLFFLLSLSMYLCIFFSPLKHLRLSCIHAPFISKYFSMDFFEKKDILFITIVQQSNSENLTLIHYYHLIQFIFRFLSVALIMTLKVFFELMDVHIYRTFGIYSFTQNIM